MHKLFTYLIVLLAGTMILSCTKEEDLAPLPQDKIVEYSVNNVPAGTSLYGAIDNEKKIITLYVPFYLGLDLIDADIKVSPGAKLQEEILPIPIDTEDQTYTVVAADGSTNTYELLIVPQNTPPLEVVWDIRNYPAAQPMAYPLTVLPDIKGNFYTQNVGLVNVTLVSRSTKQEVLLNTSAGQSSLVAIRGEGEVYAYKLTSLPIPMEVEEGEYDVRIDFLGQQVVLQDPLTIQYRNPRINYAPGTLVQQGTEATFKANPGYLILDPTSVTATDMNSGIVYDLAIVKYDKTNITVKIPDDFPLGMPTATLIIETTYKGYPSTSSSTYFNVTPK